MHYVIVDSSTRCSVRHPRTGKQRYATLAAARAAMTRLVNIDREAYVSLKKYPRTDYEIMDEVAYAAQVPMREVTNLMTGKKVMERADLPWGCSVASDSYWSS
jgi:hypothetical protein